jgi:hypothetical protein
MCCKGGGGGEELRGKENVQKEQSLHRKENEQNRRNATLYEIENPPKTLCF